MVLHRLDWRQEISRLFTFTISAELFPVDMRAALSGFCNFAVNIYIFLVIKTFPDREYQLITLTRR